MKSSQDLSSQVMVEVGLALAMAFFSLFVLTLFSFNIPNITAMSEKQELHNKPQHTSYDKHEGFLNISASHKATGSIESTDKQSNDLNHSTLHNNEEDTRFIFFNGKQYYDESLTPVSIKNLPVNVNVVVAVPESLQLSELITIQKQINHPKASITNLTSDWLKAMEQLP